MADPKKLTIDAALQVEGSEDTIQLEVKGSATQTAPLQEWQDASGEAVARLGVNGRLQVGDLDLDTPEALVEANEEVSLPSDRPLRGIQSLGQIAGEVGDAIAWAAHELQLLGSGGVTGLHAALRAVLRLGNSGGASQAELRAGDFEVANASNPAAKVVGVSSAITNEIGGDITEAAAFSVATPVNQGTIGTLVGLDMPDLDQADENFAIRTGKGQVHLGDFLEMEQLDTAPGGSSGVVRIYPKTDGKLYAKAPGGVEYDLTGGGGGGGASTFDDLSDVSITSPAQGDVLMRGATEWVNANIPASRIVGRKSSGDVGPLTGNEAKDILGILHSDISDFGTYAATPQLDNLSSVAINTSLISDTDDTDDLGSDSILWRAVKSYLKVFKERPTPSTPSSGLMHVFADAAHVIRALLSTGMNNILHYGDEVGYKVWSNTAAAQEVYKRTIKGGSVGAYGKVVEQGIIHLHNVSAGAGRTLQLSFIFGGTTLFTLPLTAQAAGNGQESIFHYTLTVTNQGAANAQVATLWLSALGGQAYGTGGTGLTGDVARANTATEDTTADLDLVINGTMSVANAGLSMYRHSIDMFGPYWHGA